MQKYNNELLIEQIKQGKDVKNNYEKLYKNNYGIIKTFALKYAKSEEDIEDYLQDSYIALVKAANYYNPEKEIKFISVLVWFLKRCGWEMYSKRRYDISLDETIDEEGEISRLDLLTDNQAEQNIIQPIEDIELHRMLVKIISRLSEKEQDILISHFFKNQTLEQIAARYDLSLSRIAAIENHALRKLYKDRKTYEDLDGFIGWSYSPGLNRFRNTGESCVEAEVLHREKELELKLKHIRNEWQNFINEHVTNALQYQELT